MKKGLSKRVLAFLFVAMFLTTLLPASFSVFAKEDESAKKQGDTFTVGFDAEFPPYGYKDENGEYVGFDLSLAEEVCKRNGWKLVKKPINWDSKDMELESGAIDCIWNGFTMNGREEQYTFSKPYVDNSQVIVIKTGSDIKSKADLAGKTVIVQADSSALAAFTSEDAEEDNLELAKSFKDLKQVADYNTAFLNLESGACDAVVLDIGVAKYQVQSREGFTMLDEKVSTEQYGIGFKLGNEALRDQVQTTLDEMAADGSFDQIAEEWGLSDSVCLGKDETGKETASTEDASSNDATTLDEAGTGAKKAGDKFTVGFDAEFPPYGYKDDNGEYVGFDLSLAEEVCKRRGWDLVKKPINWDSKDMELESGAIDCIWNGFTMNGREEQYTFSEPYVDNSQVIVVKEGSSIKSKADLAGKSVIVQADSSALAAFTSEDAEEDNLELAKSFKDLKQVADYNTAFLNLESGACDAVVLDIGVAKYQVQSRKGFVMLDEKVSTEQYGIGFKLGNEGLRNQVQNTLNEMAEDGTFAQIAEEWGISDSVCLGKDKAAIASANDAGVASASDAALTGKKAAKASFWGVVKSISKGILTTMAIFFLTLIFSLPLGLLLTAIRMSRFAVLRWIAKIYISIMRGTPLMLQLIVVCYGPYYAFGWQTSSNYPFYAVIIGFSINYAAYFAEIFRAGIEGIPKGQHEAAQILGYSKAQKFWRIIFPQMVKRTVPPVTNEVITLVKDTSLAFVLACPEVFTIAKQDAAFYASLMPLFVAGLFYYIFNAVVAFVMSRIEKSMKFSV